MNIPSPEAFLLMMKEKKQEKIQKGKEKVLANIEKPQFLDMNSSKTNTKEVIGGKSVGLGNLLTLKESLVNTFEIPNFFMVVTDYFELIKAELNLLQVTTTNLETLNKENVSMQDIETFSITLIPKLESDIIDYLVDEVLKKVQEKGWTRFIVRSSCNLEDDHSTPFAGVFESVLVENVNASDITKAIKKVYSSAYTPRSDLYCKHHDKSMSDISMGLIIQEVPDVNISGSAFVNNDVITIEDGLGLCDPNINSHITCLITEENNHPAFAIAKEIRGKGYNNFTIEFVLNNDNIYLVQLRQIPIQSSSVIDTFENKENYIKVYSGQTKSINFGNAEGLALRPTKDNLENLEQEIILISDFDTLYNIIQKDKEKVKNSNVKGFVIVSHSVYFHLSLIFKELLDVPVIFVSSDFLDKLENKTIAINIGVKSTIYERRG